MKRPRRVVVALVLATVVIISLVIASRLSPRQGWLPMGQSRVSWGFRWSGWRIASWSGRDVEWDEPPEGQPMIPQVYQMRRTEYGPLVVLARHRVPPRSGDVME